MDFKDPLGMNIERTMREIKRMNPLTPPFKFPRELDILGTPICDIFDCWHLAEDDDEEKSGQEREEDVED